MIAYSMFDGMSCGQIALRELGIIPDTYYSSEIDPYAQSVTRYNFPNTVFLGDVTGVDFEALPVVNLLMAGSPCQDLSRAKANGKGLEGVYPSLVGSDWVEGSEDRLIRIVLHGLSGPIEVTGKRFQSSTGVPMPALGGLNNQQIVDVLNYVRAAFGNQGKPVTLDRVEQMRRQHAGRSSPWTADEL